MLSNLQLFLLVLILSIFNWLMTFLGSSLVYFIKSKSQKLVSIALGLAAGIMIAATFFSLLLVLHIFLTLISYSFNTNQRLFNMFEVSKINNTP